MSRIPRNNASKIVIIAAVVVALIVLTVLLGSRKNLQPRHYIQLTIDGIRGGSIYALMALGFVMVYSVTGIINFAQGEFVMLGAMICLTVNDLDLPLPPALKLAASIVVGVLATTLIGIIMERLTIYPARHFPPVTLIIITIGVTITLRAGALLAWGADPYVLPAFTTQVLEDHVFRLGGSSGGVIVQAQSLWIWGTLIVVLIVLYVFLERTIMGKALRACAVNRRAAQLMGINPSWMSMLSFAMAAALGAIGGIVLGPVTRPIYDMGLMLGLRGFVAAIMGGLVSAPGAVVGGLILGVVENVAAGVTNPTYKSVISFIILIAILLFRPQGIIGGGESRSEEA
ncbi:MAG: branched-chain amino acid ABC transporter permease [Anaerolineae bacterium]|nr:branched-chain amino acid ABC transporter permease [Anaerolineae bacterium]